MVYISRLSYVSSDIGPDLPLSIFDELFTKKATHVNLHGNRLSSLDIPSTWKHRRKNGTCIEHIVDLILSSNCLHEGYALPHIAPPRDSLLQIAPRLRCLNLSANDLTEKSLSRLLRNRKNNVGEEVGALSSLQELDISHNKLLRLPIDLHSMLPNLRRLNASSNNIKSLSSTIQALHPYRGILECVQFSDARNRNEPRPRENPICYSKFYREKLVFVLGDKLNRLDYVVVTRNEREQIRIALENDMANTDTVLPIASIRQGLCNNTTTHPIPHSPGRLENGLNLRATNSNRGGYDIASRQKQERNNERAKPSNGLEFDDPFPDEYAVEDTNLEKSSQDQKNLEDEVALLSAMVGNQAHLTQELLRYAYKSKTKVSDTNMVSILGNRNQCDSNTANVLHMSRSTQTMSTSKTRQFSCTDRNLALLVLVIKFAFSRREETMKRIKQHHAFSLWSLLMHVSKYKTQLDDQLARSEHKWRKHANQQVQAQMEREKDKIAAVEEENRCLRQKLSLMSTEIEDMKTKVESETSDKLSISQGLQKEKAALKRAHLEMETKLRKDIDEKDDQVMQLVAERNRLNHELGRVKGALDDERQRACQELDQLASIRDAKLEDMKAQMLQKDVRTLYIMLFLLFCLQYHPTTSSNCFCNSGNINKIQICIRASYLESSIGKIDMRKIHHERAASQRIASKSNPEIVQSAKRIGEGHRCQVEIRIIK